MLEQMWIWILEQWNSLEITAWDVLMLAINMAVGGWMFLFVLPLIPGAIDALSNKPNRFKSGDDPGERNYEPSRFGFFTSLSPGRVKIIEMSGERFVKCIMRFNGFSFRGDHEDGLNPSQRFEVTPTPNGKKDSHPIPVPRFAKGLVGALLFPIRFLWWVWKREVYMITGHVFTGIYPFRMVRVYPIERFNKEELENGDVVMIRKDDYSDHYRVADFQFPAVVHAADTLDKIPVDMAIDMILRCFNPYEAAYGTDDWAKRTAAVISSTVVNFTRPRNLEVVLSATEATVHDLPDRLMAIGDRSAATPAAIVPYGFEARQALIIDISAVEELSEQQRRLADEAFARIDRDAAKLRAEGKAADISKQAEAMSQYPEQGELIALAEARVRAAAALPTGSIAVLGDGGRTTDPTLAAILNELRRLNTSTDQT